MNLKWKKKKKTKRRILLNLTFIQQVDNYIVVENFPRQEKLSVSLEGVKRKGHRSNQMRISVQLLR